MRKSRAHKIANEVVGRITQRGEMLPVREGAVGIDYDDTFWVDNGEFVVNGLDKESAAEHIVEFLTAK